MKRNSPAKYYVFLSFRIICLTLPIALASSCTINTIKAPKYTDKEPLTKIENKEELTEKGRKACENFHRLMNEGNYEEMFKLIDSQSELSHDKAVFFMIMGKIDRELGKLESAEFTRSALFQKKSTNEIRLEYISKFNKESRKEPRYELFSWEIYNDGTIKLLNYRNGIDNEQGYAY